MDDSETIYLVHSSGETIQKVDEWRGGDVLYLPKRQRLPAAIDFDAVPKSEPIQNTVHTFRRSLVTRDMFVLQP